MNALLPNLVTIVFDVVTLLVFLRFIFQLAGLSTHHPVVMSTYRTTKLVDVFGRILPTIAGGRLNIAALILIILLRMLQLTFTHLLAQGNGLAPDDLVLSVLFTLLFNFLQFCRYVIWGSIILSWIAAFTQIRSPYIDLVMQLAEPLCAPIRRILPDTRPLDLSAMVALFAIYACQMLLGYAAQLLQVMS